MRPWDRKKNKSEAPTQGGAWLDVGEGECPRCGVLRRMYRPVNRMDFYACVNCVHFGVLRALSNVEPEPFQQEEAA